MEADAKSFCHRLHVIKDYDEGIDTVIARMEEPDSHIELPVPLTPAKLSAVLAEARAVVERDLPFRCYYVTPEQASALPVQPSQINSFP